jgi:hypothetical protein
MGRSTTASMRRARQVHSVRVLPITSCSLPSVVLLLKLLFMAEREIVPERDDNVGYIRFSLESFASAFGGDASHPPGASLLIALARSLGLPYRVFIEVALAAAALLLFRPLVLSGCMSLPTAVIACAVLIFHPVLLLEMDRAMGDPVGFLWWLFGTA